MWRRPVCGNSVATREPLVSTQVLGDAERAAEPQETQDLQLV